MQTERYAVRDRSYGIWHRVKSIARFLHPREAAALTMADVDSVLFTEYNWGDKMPLCLVEVGLDIGQEKQAEMLQALARRADLPAYLCLYTHASTPNPSDDRWPDIQSFRVRRIWPLPDDSWRVMTPLEWAEQLVVVRRWQLCRMEVREAANDPIFDDEI